ncbi:unnamed protein product [Owenia fusiformis]|uniref:Transcription factor spt8 beta-propeller domain-containing protein n=1 Tax=Owenia fusiformis TaxID=6347 RepID=A0A8J1XWE7_OWEFU|nr:unnamed protein product [Owenia fusiformis]
MDQALGFIWNREIISKRGTQRTFQQKLNDIIENFQCVRSDQHVIEGQEIGDIVPPFACSFSRVSGCGHMIAIVDEDGAVCIYDTNISGPRANKLEWLAHNNAVFDVTWVEQENKLLTASGDQTISLWDVDTTSCLGLFKGHSSSVKSVNFRPQDKSVFASGSRDGHIMIWDARCNEKDGFMCPTMTIKNAHCCHTVARTTKQKRGSKATTVQDSQQSVTCVLFQDDNTLISAGAVDGVVKVWDLRQKLNPKFIFPYAGTSTRKHGFSSLVLDSTYSRLFASCTDSSIYQFNCANFNKQPVVTYQGHMNSTFYVKSCLSPDDRFLLSGSSDNNAYIWNVDSPMASPVLLKGHTKEVTAVAWCPTDIFKIVTLADDDTVNIWRSTQSSLSPEPGTVVGAAVKSHIGDNGTSTNSSSARNPSNFTGISPMHNPSNTQGQQTTAPIATKTLTPSIKEWLGKITKAREKKIAESPCKKSPRKLLSPRKLTIGPIRDKENIHVGVKRKLCETLSPEVSQKRKCLNKIDKNDAEYNMNRMENKLEDSKVNEHFKDVKKPLSPRIYQSPTSNLPNFVLDPDSRKTPCALNSNTKKSNWLTKLSQQRRASVGVDSVSPNDSVFNSEDDKLSRNTFSKDDLGQTPKSSKIKVINHESKNSPSGRTSRRGSEENATTSQGVTPKSGRSRRTLLQTPQRSSRPSSPNVLQTPPSRTILSYFSPTSKQTKTPSN